MKILIKILFIPFILCLLINQASAKNGFFSANINKENQKKEENLVLNKSSQKEYEDLKTFLKSNIIQSDLDEIDIEIKNYLVLLQELDKQIKDTIEDEEENNTIRNQIFQEKISTYKFIYTYVDKNKVNDFREYIKNTVKSSKDRKILLDEINKTQQELDEKISTIKEKIESNKEELNSKIDDIINSKIIERINQIDTNEKYKKISQKTKNEIYSGFIINLNQRKLEINNSNLSENYKKIRIKIIDKMIDEISQKIKK